MTEIYCYFIAFLKEKISLLYYRKPLIQISKSFIKLFENSLPLMTYFKSILLL